MRKFTKCPCPLSGIIIKYYLISRFPLLLMSIAYFQIVRVLWRSDTIPGHREISTQKENCCRSKDIVVSTRKCLFGCYSIFIITDRKSNTLHYESNSTTMNQLRARRKASKMLVIVVLIFAACYFPVHALNILRYSYTDINQSEVISVLFLLSHWLDYD